MQESCLPPCIAAPFHLELLAGPFPGCFRLTSRNLVTTKLVFLGISALKRAKFCPPFRGNDTHPSPHKFDLHQRSKLAILGCILASIKKRAPGNQPKKESNSNLLLDESTRSSAKNSKSGNIYFRLGQSSTTLQVS